MASEGSLFQPDPPEVERIELIEGRILELQEAIRRSRMLMLAGRTAAIAGPALILGFLVGIPDFTPARTVVAIALAIGGVVLMGSSKSSTEQLERALREAEDERNAEIDSLDLRPPEGRAGDHGGGVS
jgi:hypothetical protein